MHKTQWITRLLLSTFVVSAISLASFAGQPTSPSLTGPDLQTVFNQRQDKSLSAKETTTLYMDTLVAQSELQIWSDRLAFFKIEEKEAKSHTGLFGSLSADTKALLKSDIERAQSAYFAAKSDFEESLRLLNTKTYRAYSGVKPLSRGWVNHFVRHQDQALTSAKTQLDQAEDALVKSQQEFDHSREKVENLANQGMQYFQARITFWNRLSVAVQMDVLGLEKSKQDNQAIAVINNWLYKMPLKQQNKPHKVMSTKKTSVTKIAKHSTVKKHTHLADNSTNTAPSVVEKSAEPVASTPATAQPTSANPVSPAPGVPASQPVETAPAPSNAEPTPAPSEQPVMPAVSEPVAPAPAPAAPVPSAAQSTPAPVATPEVKPAPQPTVPSQDNNNFAPAKPAAAPTSKNTKHVTPKNHVVSAHHTVKPVKLSATKKTHTAMKKLVVKKSKLTPVHVAHAKRHTVKSKTSAHAHKMSHHKKPKTTVSLHHVAHSKKQAPHLPTPHLTATGASETKQQHHLSSAAKSIKAVRHVHVATAHHFYILPRPDSTAFNLLIHQA